MTETTSAKVSTKPLGRKNYGSIGHLPGSRMGPGDHKVPEGMDRICTIQKRDKHDTIIVQEKLDGSNVGVANIDGSIVALSRSGYLASTSPYPQHHAFSDWVAKHTSRFLAVLMPGERLVGEWLMQAHGTRYALAHEPFVAFDLMRESTRTPFAEFTGRVGGTFVTPFVVSVGEALSVADAMASLGPHGKHGAIDQVEGAMWRVERKGKVDFLAKYVRPEKLDGCYLQEVSGKPPVWNYQP